jgi:predicted esterase
MRRFLALLPLVLLGTVAFAAPGLKPGGFAEFKAELPRELRLVAGQGQLSPVEHALITIGAPANLDPAREWPVLVVSATSDPQYNSSRRLLAAYADTALKAGWIVVAVDPMEAVAVDNDSVGLRVALNTTALAVLELQWPSAAKAPVAFGGISGGAKYSGWLAAAFASRGRNVAGIYLAGINADAVISSARHFNVLNAQFKRTPVFLQYGDADSVATPSDHWSIHDELKRAGFKNVRIESFRGAHEVHPAPLGKALDWFRERAALAGTAK